MLGVGCLISDGGFRVCAAVIKYMLDGVESGGGGSGELRGEGDQGGMEGETHSACIVEKFNHNYLGMSNLLMV
jgi:hypothetical protein